MNVLQVHSIIRHVAEVCHQNMEELYRNVGWPLYRKYGHAYDGFKVTLDHRSQSLTCVCVCATTQGCCQRA